MDLGHLGVGPTDFRGLMDIELIGLRRENLPGASRRLMNLPGASRRTGSKLKVDVGKLGALYPIQYKKRKKNVYMYIF